MAHGRYVSMEVEDGGYHVGVIHTLTGTEFLLPGQKLVVVKPPGTWDLPWGFGFKLGLASIGSMVRMVEEPRDLVDAVSITSPALALRYARLFTSPAIAELLKVERWFEVVPMSAVDDSFYFGREDRPWPIRPEARLRRQAEQGPDWRDKVGIPRLPLPKDPEARRRMLEKEREWDARRYYGVLYDHEWQEEGFPAPEVEQTPDGFVVRRVLFQAQPSESTRTAWWVSESIRRDGLLHRRQLRELHTSERIALAVPRFV